MDPHRADRDGATAAGRRSDNPRTSTAVPLPLAARRVLWQCTWDRLLAPSAPEPEDQATAPTSPAEEPAEGGPR